jgi:hypothetical protein
MSDHALQSIPGGCFHVRVTLALVSFSSVGWRNCSSYLLLDLSLGIFSGVLCAP